MTRAITASLAILLLTASPMMAALVTIGNHPLRPNQANQTIQVLVQGGEQIQGMELRAMIGGGGTAHGGVAGPIFKVPGPPINPIPLPDPLDNNDPNWDPAMLPGTIWQTLNDSGVRIDTFPDPYTDHAQLFLGGVTTGGDYSATVPAGTPTESAVLVNFVIDTTDFNSGTWDLELTGTPDGITKLLAPVLVTPGDPPEYFVESVSTAITNGTIQITAPLNSIDTGNWNAGTTWDGGGALPTIFDMTGVGNHVVTVDSDGEAFSLAITNAGGKVAVNSGRKLDLYDSLDVGPGTVQIALTGELNVGAGATTAAGSTLVSEVSGSDGGVTSVTDELDLSAAGDALALEWIPGPAKFGGDYEVANYGSRTGTFDALGGGNIGIAYYAGIDHVTDDKVTVSLFDLLDADADLDGDVDFGDYMILEASFGGPGQWKDADFDFNGVVDFGDYMILE
ncbi:MAG: hypothetical protein HQ567_18220, partial [Candidatus Nealsonbacteria bacterium]|nr:hypothetical protein [Candidatus Nealsonbacteria bacterium]